MKPDDRVLVDWERGELEGTVISVDKDKVSVRLDPPIDEVTVPAGAVKPAEEPGPDQVRQRPMFDKAGNQQPRQGAGGQESSEGQHAFDSE